MSKYKLSPWHDGSVKPEMCGVYRFKNDCDGEVYRYWNGYSWCYFGNTVDSAYRNSQYKLHVSNKGKWRGILK